MPNSSENGPEGMMNKDLLRELARGSSPSRVVADEHCRGVPVFRVTGGATGGEAVDLCEELLLLMPENAVSVIVDLSECPTVATFVLATLAFLAKERRRQGGLLLLCGAGERVRRSLRVLNLDALLHIHDSADEAAEEAASFIEQDRDNADSGDSKPL